MKRANLRRKWSTTISNTAENLSKAGWSWDGVSAIDSNGRTIFVADAHRDDGKRFVVRADEKLTAFLELESDGALALLYNLEGSANTATGAAALSNTTGSNNVALGSGAGLSATSGSGNVYIGAGMQGVAGESDACYIRSIFSRTSASGIPVLINSSNKLGTTTSSKRFKEDIKPMDRASEAILALKPVTFRYKKEIDPAGTSQFGLVAEEVEKVNPDLVVRDKEGRPYSVRYDQVNAMLLNEFLKEHRKVEEQEATIAQQKRDFQATVAQQRKEIQALAATVKEQAAQIQKVSVQLAAASPSGGGLQASKFARHTAGRIRGGGPAPQVVNNP